MKKSRLLSAIIVLALMASILGTASVALAVTPPSYLCSDNIALVPSANCVNGGTLPTTGYPATTPTGATFSPSFTNVSPADISNPAVADPIAAGGYDTVVLNAISSSYLTPTLFSRLESFVRGGGKLLIYTSERTSGDWTGFVRPFESNTPGAYGATGTLGISENNTLSDADSNSPYYIDVVKVGSNTDAVGDANVFVTYDPNWCEDMWAINLNGVDGPVHCYSHLDYGLIIYNGLDIDYMGGSYSGNPAVSGADYVEKIFGLELMQPWNPSGLVCGVQVAGQLSLDPVQATNPTGTEHCLTATVLNAAGAPAPGVTVTFTVTGVNPTSGQAVTDSNGEATWCYTGAAEGLDTIVATCDDPDTQQMTLISNDAYKDWTPGGEPEPPIEVGGDVSPVNRISLLIPWIGLATIAMVIAGFTMALRRRRI